MNSGAVEALNSEVSIGGGAASKDAASDHGPVMLQVRAIAARRLKAMDRNGFSDPYLKMQIGNGADKRQRCQTKVVKKNLNPEWHETFELLVTDVNDVLKVSVFDSDLIGSDDLIGHTLLPLSELVGLEGDDAAPKWHDITDDQSQTTGQVFLGLHLPRPDGYQTYQELADEAAAAAAEAFEQQSFPIPEDDPAADGSRKLAISIVKGKQLKALDFNGSSDAYVTVALVHGEVWRRFRAEEGGTGKGGRIADMDRDAFKMRGLSVGERVCHMTSSAPGGEMFGGEWRDGERHLGQHLMHVLAPLTLPSSPFAAADGPPNVPNASRPGKPGP